MSQAVNISSDHFLLNALDQRVATLEKLGQLQTALRDSKRMIDLKPELAKVFLPYLLLDRSRSADIIRDTSDAPKSFSSEVMMLWLLKSMNVVLRRSKLELTTTAQYASILT